MKRMVDTNEPGPGGLRGSPPVVEMFGTGNNIQELIRRLSRTVGRPIIDKTDITWRFDFTMKFAPQALRPIPTDSPNESGGLIFSRPSKNNSASSWKARRGRWRCS
jgi:uncharacterized protein (TIGR03435 family)